MKIKYIKLSNGMNAIIDAEDWKKVKHLTWGFGYGSNYKSGFPQYVGANIYKEGKSVLLHRFIMNTPKGMHTDYINGNHLDNRKSNLRICTAAQNQFNSKKTIKKSSDFKGVSWFKRDSCWRSYICKSRKQYHLGYFDSEIKAAKKYNEAARDFFGEFALLNNI